MTTTQRNILRDLIQPTILLFLIGVFVQQVQWQGKINNRIENLEEHAKDKILHMPFEKSIEVFVPRVELERRMNNIENSLNKIENKIDKLK